jgi:hypothetical protein
MEFKVPQFLEIEDKIFGPFTFRQFVYLVGGGGLCFIIYRAVGFYFGIIPIILIGGFAGALTFYRPNNKPFINMLESVFKYAFQDKLYIWKRSKNVTKGTQIDDNKASYQVQNGSRLNTNKLRDLAWSLDVLDLKK